MNRIRSPAFGKANRLELIPYSPSKLLDTSAADAKSVERMRVKVSQTTYFMMIPLQVSASTGIRESGICSSVLSKSQEVFRDKMTPIPFSSWPSFYDEPIRFIADLRFPNATAPSGASSVRQVRFGIDGLNAAEVDVHAKRTLEEH